MDKQSIISGLQVGSLIAGMRRVYKIPVAYLYNGIQLPPLPDWDKEVYPYAAICSPIVLGIVNNNSYLFVATSAPLYVVKGTGSTYLKSTDDVTYRNCSYNTETATWNQLGDEVTGTINKSWEVRWVNYDILKNNGTLYLAASDPIPVYE